MTEKPSASYALPCVFGSPFSFDPNSTFYTKFNTKNEREAEALSRCIMGKRGPKYLCIVSEEGEVYPF